MIADINKFKFTKTPTLIQLGHLEWSPFNLWGGEHSNWRVFLVIHSIVVLLVRDCWGQALLVVDTRTNRAVSERAAPAETHGTLSTYWRLHRRDTIVVQPMQTGLQWRRSHDKTKWLPQSLVIDLISLKLMLCLSGGNSREQQTLQHRMAICKLVPGKWDPLHQM